MCSSDLYAGDNYPSKLMSAFDPLRTFAVNQGLWNRHSAPGGPLAATKRLLRAKSGHDGRHSAPFYQRTVLSRSSDSLYPVINGRS